MTDLLCYLNDDGSDVIRHWYSAQGRAVQGAFVATVESLRHRPRHWWRRRLYGELRGQCCFGLGELRIEEPKGVHYRVLGFFNGDSSCFVLVYAFLKDCDPEYVLACSTAQERKSHVERDWARCRKCGFPASN
jgi:hypothetical protein